MEVLHRSAWTGLEPAGGEDNGGMTDSPRAETRFLAPSQVAELLEVDVDETIALVLEGRLRGVQVGVPPRWRIEQASIEEYLAEQTEVSRRMALWRQSNEASFPEVWGAARHRI